MIRPKAIEDEGVRKSLADWPCEIDTSKTLDQIALQGSYAVLDEINGSADLYINITDQDDPEIVVHLFDDYLIAFDLLGPLKDGIENAVDTSKIRKMWNSELEPLRALSTKLKGLAVLADSLIAREQERGTLNQQVGMDYDEWEAGGRLPPLDN